MRRVDWEDVHARRCLEDGVASSAFTRTMIKVMELGAKSR